MKEIVEIERTKTRLVQPVDFSFLSDADKDIVKGIEALVRTMYGIPTGYAIVLEGLVYTGATGMVSDGTVLYNGRIYEVTGGQFDTSVSGGSTPATPVYRVLNLYQITVDPSPVKDKNGSANIECHKRNYGTVDSAAVSGAIFSSSFVTTNSRIIYLKKLQVES